MDRKTAIMFLVSAIIGMLLLCGSCYCQEQPVAGPVMDRLIKDRLDKIAQTQDDVLQSHIRIGGAHLEVLNKFGTRLDRITELLEREPQTVNLTPLRERLDGFNQSLKEAREESRQMRISVLDRLIEEREARQAERVEARTERKRFLDGLGNRLFWLIVKFLCLSAVLLVALWFLHGHLKTLLEKFGLGWVMP